MTNSATTISELRCARTFLFVPGSRGDRFDKAVAAGADVVILDLEDAVSSADKHDARQNVREWLAAGGRAAVRVNAVGTPWHTADLDTVSALGAPVVLPKAEDPAAIARIAGLSPAMSVIPLVETARGVAAAEEIAAAPGIARLAFGSIDFAAQLGIDPLDREALLLARSSLVVASAAAGLAGPVDGVTTALADPGVTADDVGYARRLGMSAKLCIHPSQVATVHAALTPSESEIAWAQSIVDVCGTDGGAVAVDGQMVDPPVVARARGILSAAARR